MYVFDEEFAKVVSAAETSDVPEPVIAVLDEKSNIAQSIHAALHDACIVPRQLMPRLSGAIITLAPDEAISQLRQHADLGGMAVASLIDSLSPRPDRWVLLLMPEHMAISALKDGHVTRGCSAYYHQLPYPMTCPDCARRTHRGVVPVHLGGGVTTTICVSRVSEVCRSAALVRIVYSRELPTPGQAADLVLPIDDDFIAVILQRFYLDHAPTVAEAVRALRKTEGNHARELLDLLGSREELACLRNQVVCELG